ncbi:MAG: hypothetical protein JSW68_12200 [Burkholderiales bacterium]|nr:MAG: hypothetical protein JSW68_12200 [Burkholderiales bacterium]
MTRPLPTVDGKCTLDMHVHIGPELLRRRYSAESLAEEARREGFGVVMKNHFQPTTGWVSQLRRDDDRVPLVGSVALNFGAGGVDDHGVRAALSGWKRDVGQADPDPERFVVWMPTLCTEAHLNLFGRRDIPLEWGVAGRYTRYFPLGSGFAIDTADPKQVAAIDRALAAVRELDLVLATGHLNRHETAWLVERAHATGQRRIVMTHPLFQATQQTLDTLSRLWRECGAYTELAFVNIAMDHLSYESYAAVIEAVGAEGVVLSSDLGQPFSPPVGEGLREYFDCLRGQGVRDDAIEQMAVLNPHSLLFG